MEEIKTIAKVGRKSKYTPEACQAVVDAAARGEHVAGMILAAGATSRQTFYNWRKEHPEFDQACKSAELISLAFYEKVGQMGIQGLIKGFNATAWIMVMNNKFKDEYSRSGSGSNTEITVNTLNLSDSEKMQKIAQKLEKLKALGVDLDGEE